MKKLLSVLFVTPALILVFAFASDKSQSEDGSVTINALNYRPFRTEIDGNIAHIGENFGVFPDSTFEPLKSAGITELRLHDTKSFDWDNIFTDFNADPDAPQSYNFTNCDRILKAMVRMGFVPFLRLGVSTSAITLRRTQGLNPPDIDKWTRIVNRIVDHYVNGWANGYHYNIKYIEVWSEPDLPFWGGSQDKFNRMCGKALTVLKTNYPNIKVGACGVGNSKNSKAFVNSLLSYLSDPNNDGSTSDRIPLDFFSWHVYEMGKGLGLFIPWANAERAALNKAGYNNTASFCTEYNTYLPSPYLTTDNAAVDAASTLIWSEENNIGALFFYPLIANWGLFNQTTERISKKISVQPTGMANSYILYHTLRVNTPEFIQIDNVNVSDDFQVIAAKSADGKTFQILVAYKGNTSKRVKFSIKGISASNPVIMSKTFKDLTLKSDNEISLLRNKKELDFDYTIDPSSVKLIKISL